MRRRIPLLVLLYVTLDFANPLMPGAVRFEGGSVEVVQADRSARAGVPTILVPEMRPVVVVPPVGARVRPTLVPRIPTRSPRRGARKVKPPRRPDPPPSTTEDH